MTTPRNPPELNRNQEAENLLRQIEKNMDRPNISDEIISNLSKEADDLMAKMEEAQRKEYGTRLSIALLNLSAKQAENKPDDLDALRAMAQQIEMPTEDTNKKRNPKKAAKETDPLADLKTMAKDIEMPTEYKTKKRKPKKAAKEKETDSLADLRAMAKDVEMPTKYKTKKRKPKKAAKEKETDSLADLRAMAKDVEMPTDIFLRYIHNVQDKQGPMHRAFDKEYKFIDNDKAVNQALEMAADRIKLIAEKIQADGYDINYISQQYNEMVKGLKTDLKLGDFNDTQIQEIARNFLFNAIGRYRTNNSIDLTNPKNKEAFDYLNLMLTMYDDKNPNEKMISYLEGKFKLSPTKEALMKYLAIGGEENFTKAMANVYKGNQNNFVDMVSALDLQVANQAEEKLKRILDTKIYEQMGIKQPRNHVASAALEFGDGAINLSNNMATLSKRLESAKQGLKASDYEKLRILMLPYVALEQAAKKLQLFNKEDAEKHGLNLVKDFGNASYFTYEDSNDPIKKKMADDYIAQLQAKILDLPNNKDYQEFIQLLRACSSVYTELNAFIPEIGKKYGVQMGDTSNPLHTLLYGDNVNKITNFNSLALKAIQDGPRVPMLTDEMFKRNKVGDALADKYEAKKEQIQANDIINSPLPLSGYLQSDLVKNASKDDKEMTKGISNLQEKFLHNDKMQYKNEMHKALDPTNINNRIQEIKDNPGEEEKIFKKFITSLLISCKGYYQLEASHSKHAEHIVKDLDNLIQEINKTKTKEFTGDGLADKLRVIMKQNQHGGLSQMFSHSDTFTTTIKQTIDAVSQMKQVIQDKKGESDRRRME